MKNILYSSGLTYMLVSKFQKKQEFFQYPFNLSLLNIFSVSDLSNDVFIHPIAAVAFKCVLLPHPTSSNYSVAIPLIHHS